LSRSKKKTFLDLNADVKKKRISGTFVITRKQQSVYLFS
jgi:hypothetical protein